MRAHVEGNMTREEIYQKIKDAKNALSANHPDAATVSTVVKPATHQQYLKEAKRVLGTSADGNIAWPIDANAIVTIIQQSAKNSTLQKKARSVRHILMHQLNDLVKSLDTIQRKGNWALIERIVSHQTFDAMITLTKMMPADYKVGWKATAKRKGKKSSLNKLQKDWREIVASQSKGQYRLPALVTMMTGCRPAELVKGVKLIQKDGCVFVEIAGSKVTDKAGQEYRKFKLADHPVTQLIINEMNATSTPEAMEVKARRSNSVTTHLRAIAQKLWPNRNESITSYSARHAMAAECKYAVNYEDADPDLTSKVLGHVVDKTASYYGNASQAGGFNVLPSEVKTPHPIRHKVKARNAVRKANNAIPKKPSKTLKRKK